MLATADYACTMKWVWLALLLAVLFFLFFMPQPVFYSQHKVIGWGIYGLIFIVLPVAVYKVLHGFEVRTSWCIGCAIGSVLVVGPSFGTFHQYQEVLDLKRSGVWSRCVVVDEKFIDKRRHPGWVIKCSFENNGKAVETSYEPDEENRYSIGDTLELIHLVDQTKVYEMDFQWNE